MGKVSQKDLDSKTYVRKRKVKGSRNKYLKPGALAQQLCSKASATKSCKSPFVLSPVNVVKVVRPMEFANLQVESNKYKKSPLMVSPVDIVVQNARTPKTPQAEPYNSESQLESLPMDVLVKIICHLNHDQLKTVFHVSERIREATKIARNYYFNYTTPARSRQEMMSVMAPSKGDGNATMVSTPKAPKHAPRPRLRTKLTEMKPIAAVLFQDQTTFPSRCILPSVLHKPTLFKPMTPKHPRVVVNEDELCKAVAQNNLT